MEAAKKNELYAKLQELSEMASDICGELHGIADRYYEYGDICSQIRGMAIDADELSSKLGDKTLLSETTTCSLLDEDTEMAAGDLVGVMKLNGTVGLCSVNEMIPGAGKADVVICVHNAYTGRLESNYHIRRIIPWSHWRAFDENDWNKFVVSLVSQKKSVSLSQLNGAFNIRVTDDVSGAVYERNGLYLKDINKSLIEDLKGLCGLT